MNENQPLSLDQEGFFRLRETFLKVYLEKARARIGKNFKSADIDYALIFTGEILSAMEEKAKKGELTLEGIDKAFEPYKDHYNKLNEDMGVPAAQDPEIQVTQLQIEKDTSRDTGSALWEMRQALRMAFMDVVRVREPAVVGAAR